MPCTNNSTLSKLEPTDYWGDVGNMVFGAHACTFRNLKAKNCARDESFLTLREYDIWRRSQARLPVYEQ
eukprot:5010774-Amphidinium_carterae.1